MKVRGGDWGKMERREGILRKEKGREGHRGQDGGEGMGVEVGGARDGERM